MIGANSGKMYFVMQLILLGFKAKQYRMVMTSKVKDRKHSISLISAMKIEK